jgi:predicted kinase
VRVSAAPVWVVAGPPGSGKSTLAAALAGRLLPAPALLDKDTLYSGFVAEVLAAHGRPHGEREGAWYDAHIKAHEYAGMLAAAAQIRAAGCAAVLVAPFTAQIRAAGRWRELVAAAGGEPVRLVWVASDTATLRRRLLARGRSRDAGKLADFDAFVARMAPGTPPAVPHLAVDCRDGAPALADQLSAAGLGGPVGAG